MDMEIEQCPLVDFFPNHSHSPPTTSISHQLLLQNDNETSLIKAVAEDDKSFLVSLSRILLMERGTVSKLLHLCCAFDSVECATSLVAGEMGAVPLLNEFDEEGVAPLHVAAKAMAARCVEMLLKKRARTDLRTRDGRGLLSLELALCAIRMEVRWNPDEYNVEDLIFELREKDLTAVKLLSEKTKEIGEVAYGSAMAGRIVDLAALLLVAAERVIGSELDLHDFELDYKQETTVYECMIREALALGSGAKSSKAAKGNSPSTDRDYGEKRKLLLCEIELLHLFGAVPQADHTNSNKKFASPLIRASQVGDRDVIKLLLRTSIDINDVDTEGNSALHWCVKSSKGSCPEQIKIMMLLMKHDARVGQKNKLGLTAVHIAAANGNSQALQLLLLKDPDCVNSKSEMKETPLFLAVKNDHKDCAELLLRWGASTEVLNLRRQRPIDLAESQDMRLMLRPINISLTNHACPIQQKHIVWLQGDEVISETCEEIVSTSSKESTPDSGTCSSTKTEVCKYFESPRGCVRGSKCLYMHAEKKLRQMKQRTDMFYSSTAFSKNLKRKIFVGGLPPSLDSDSLRKCFEVQFGSVDDAMVVGAPTGEKIVSRGFGFVTFKEMKSVSAAVAARYITIMGKQVEIKSAIPKSFLLAELQKSPTECDQLSDRHLPSAELSKTKITRKVIVCRDEKPGSNIQSLQAPIDKEGIDIPNDKNNAEAHSELVSWAQSLIYSQPKISVHELRLGGKKPPLWLKTFQRWLPRFIQEISKKEGEYALSSLKADFRGAFGLELDHASLGFTKLSDFMKCFPDICEIKFVPIGKQKPANHMVLVPTIPKLQRKPLQPLSVNNLSLQAQSTDDSVDDDCKDTKPVQDIPLVSNENENLRGNSLKVHQEIHDDNPDEVSSSETSGFLHFLKPDPIFHARPWLYSDCDGGTGDEREQLDGLQKMKTRPPQRHAVLEALARGNNNSSVFCLREFDFYSNYRACIKQGKCFGCKRPPVIWANYPCRHLLWCSDCKIQATRASSNLEHKCVVCDTKVERIYLASCHGYCQSIQGTSLIEEFPPFDPDCLRNPSKKKSSLTGNEKIVAARASA